MQKLRLKHTLTHRLSPQKLQLIKLLQVPSVAMKARIEQELAINPALEEGDNVLEEQEINEDYINDIFKKCKAVMDQKLFALTPKKFIWPSKKIKSN